MKILIVICTFISLTLSAVPLNGMTEVQKAVQLSLIKQFKRAGKTVYVMVPKNTADPFFKEAAKGCFDAAEKAGIKCVFYGSTAVNVHSQLKDVLDLINADVDGLIISAVRKGYLASNKKIRGWQKPIVSFDAPLNVEVSNAYIGTNDYQLGKALGSEIRKLRADGGTYCIQTERPDSANHNERIRGILDGLTLDGKDSNRWQTVVRCPQQTMGNFARGIKQMVTVLTNYSVDAFISTGGGPQFLPEQYRKAIAPFKQRIQSGI